MRTYLDAAPVIYLIEQVPVLAALASARLAAAGVVPVTSELTRLECLIKPLRLHNTGLLHAFEDCFAAWFNRG